MNLSARLTVMGLFLTSACCGQFALISHIRAAGAPGQGKLASPLDELPLHLGDWVGRDRAITDPKVLYGEAHLQREYNHRYRPQRVMVWMAYSQHGKDRSHHPEICMAVAGQPEDRSARKEIRVSAEGEPVQQYRFGRTGSSQWIYYWYYSLASEQPSQASWLQQVFWRWRFRSASVTIEVFAPESDTGDEREAQEFVRLLDVAVGSIVGSSATRGSQRLPVVRIDAET